MHDKDVDVTNEVRQGTVQVIIIIIINKRTCF